MTLTQFTFNTTSPGTYFIENRLIPQLQSITDQSKPTPLNIFGSISAGLDIVLQQAVEGQISPNDCPIARIFYDPDSLIVDNSANVVVEQQLPLDIYVVFAIDTSPNFTMNRDQFFICLNNNIKYNVFPDGLGMKQESWWRFMPGSKTITHNTTINYLGRQIKITPESDFTVSKYSCSVIVKNYLTATELAIASSLL